VGKVGSHGGCHGGRGDRSSIHIGLRRKAYQGNNDFLIFVVPELLYISYIIGGMGRQPVLGGIIACRVTIICGGHRSNQ